MKKKRVALKVISEYKYDDPEERDAAHTEILKEIAMRLEKGLRARKRLELQKVQQQD